MLHRGFGYAAGLSFAACVAALVGALQGSQSQSGTDSLWVATLGFLTLGIVGVTGWWITKGTDEPKDPTAKADADHQSTAIAAGRDLTIGQFHASPAPPEPKAARPTPSFDLQHKASPDGFVHLALVNFADPSVFHVDITKVDRARTGETTPFPAKWRDSQAEDRQVVRESLIDIADVQEPWFDDPDSGVVFVDGTRRVGNWRAGRFFLFSHSYQAGWQVEPERAIASDGMRERVALWLEEIAVHVCAVRLDSGESIERVICIGFNPPVWDANAGWQTHKGIRVQVT